MSNILITGHTGSVGSRLKVQLQKEGHKLFFGTEGSRINDSCYFDDVEGQDLDVIFHLAAKTFVPDSWENPESFYNVNVNGTLNVLKLCRKKRVPLVFVSSYIYGEPQYLPIDENHPTGVSNPYAFSKLQAERLIQFYSDNFGVNYNIIRPFNVYGDLSNKKLLIPEIVSQIEHNDTIQVKDLKPKRDFMYIEDLVELLVLSKNKFYQTAFNAGSGESYSVGDIVDSCKEIWGSNNKIIVANEIRQNEISETLCDFSKAKETFGWAPKLNLLDGLRLMRQQRD